MNLDGARILLTGAAGGIGRHLALTLARRGARLALVGRQEAALHALAAAVGTSGPQPVVLTFDLARADGHARLVQQAALALGGLDVLVNNAGVSRFEAFAQADPAAVSAMIAVNLTSPLLLTRAALPLLQAKRGGHVLNVGSAFGALAFPHFAAYSATKFALRGFSEALRRELHGSGIAVTYVGPRATATAMNGPGVRAFFARMKTAMDTPEHVATVVVEALERNRREVHIGWPERFAVRLNALLPGLVDRVLARQVALGARCASPASGDRAPVMRDS
jgi:short-subunit dehydrogenase